MEFEEKHGLKIWWLYLVTAATIFPTAALLIFQHNGLSLAELKEMYFAPVFALVSPFLIIFLVQQHKLTLKITAEEVSFRYPPFTLHQVISVGSVLKKLTSESTMHFPNTGATA
ncbi:hypothetical protein [Pedobacter sp. P26]|uniref:hypothetical protein n=1 Tax=Pedobacter sp. P26 TaxID=3423956 RepID=UPI003D67A44C